MKITLSHIKRILWGSGTYRGSEAAIVVVGGLDIEVYDNATNNFVHSRYRHNPANPTTPP